MTGPASSVPAKPVLAPLRVGVVGVGLMGADHVQRLATRIAGVELVAIADPDTVQTAAIVADLGTFGYPGVEVFADPLELIAAEGLGQGRDVAAVLAARALIDGPRASHIVLYPVGTSDADQARNYDRLAADLARRTGRDVDVVPATGGGRRFVDTHVLPLFVTYATLLDRIPAHLPRSGPLTTDLAGVVADRYRAAAEKAA